MKRTLAILLCILLLIPAFALCASAAEPGQVYKFNYDSNLQVLVCDDFLTVGVYRLTLTAGTDRIQVDQLPVDFNLIMGEARVFEYEVVLYDDGSHKETGLMRFVNASEAYLSGTAFTLQEFPPEFYEIAELELEYIGPLESPSGNIRFVESIKYTLNVCIEWVGKVTTSLLSGELNGLLLLAAIPIAITVVMLSIKFIRKNSWGC